MKSLSLCLLLISFAVSGCKKESDLPKGWSESELNEVSDWHFNNVSTKMQTLSTRGDNAKREFSKCWAKKMANEYTYSEYKRVWKELDDYVRNNNVIITTLNESVALGQKFPFHQRMSDFGVECGNELHM